MFADFFPTSPESRSPMRASVLCATICLSFALSAQPVLQYDNVGLPGSVYDLYTVVDPGDSDFEVEGPDADWDFTTSIIDLIGAAVFTYPDFTPYGGDYPDAEVALIIINYSNGDSTYSYYDLATDGISVLAEGIGGGAPKVYSDPSTFLLYPFNYGQSFTDDYVENGTPFSVTRTYSGYGSVNLITGTTDNAVKVTASNGAKTWYRSDPVEPLLSVNAADQKLVWERITIGMAEQRGLVRMTLAPNPATTSFRIPGLDGTASYRMIDALGREVLIGRVSGAQEAIDVSALQTGMYSVRVLDARGTRTATLIKD